MTPRKNPYTLKGFMSIFQGNNTSKTETKNEKEKQIKKKITKK